MNDKVDITLSIPADHNIVERTINSEIIAILYKLTKNEQCECRILPEGDSHEIYNLDWKNNGWYQQNIDIETYSIPLTRCCDEILYSLLRSILENMKKKCKPGYSRKLVIIYRGCELNDANLDIHMGVDFQIL